MRRSGEEEEEAEEEAEEGAEEGGREVGREGGREGGRGKMFKEEEQNWIKRKCIKEKEE